MDATNASFSFSFSPPKVSGLLGDDDDFENAMHEQDSFGFGTPVLPPVEKPSVQFQLDEAPNSIINSTPSPKRTYAKTPSQTRTPLRVVQDSDVIRQTLTPGRFESLKNGVDALLAPFDMDSTNALPNSPEVSEATTDILNGMIPPSHSSTSADSISNETHVDMRRGAENFTFSLDLSPILERSPVIQNTVEQPIDAGIASPSPRRIDFVTSPDVNRSPPIFQTTANVAFALVEQITSNSAEEETRSFSRESEIATTSRPIKRPVDEPPIDNEPRKKTRPTANERQPVKKSAKLSSRNEKPTSQVGSSRSARPETSRRATTSSSSEATSSRSKKPSSNVAVPQPKPTRTASTITRPAVVAAKPTTKKVASVVVSKPVPWKKRNVEEAETNNVESLASKEHGDLQNGKVDQETEVPGSGYQAMPENTVPDRMNSSELFNVVHPGEASKPSSSRHTPFSNQSKPPPAPVFTVGAKPASSSSKDKRTSRHKPPQQLASSAPATQAPRFKSSVHAVPDFKALHASLTSKTPPVKVTVPRSPPRNLDARLAKRETFDKKVKEAEREREREKEEERKRREEEEEKDLKEERKRRVVKAHEVPSWYKDAPKVGRRRGKEGDA
ncbi:hypothetical protein DL96DRAFT_1682769 [Flagelloscypha sp. PMI_526]|nr:hypothetical protein DL96DRAFT_1682769 [Flagelloscypha sp. PMI_526]